MKAFLKKTTQALPVLLACCAFGSTQAHVLLAEQKAPADSFYKAVFQIGHSCDGSPTKEFIVEIPKGVTLAKPMFKPGWKIDIEKTKLDKPYQLHGTPITEEVTRVRWSGNTLDDNYYDEFAVRAKLPAQPGPLYWKVSQICEQGRMDWVEIPAAGKHPMEYKMPAPWMEITAPAKMEHKH